MKFLKMFVICLVMLGVMIYPSTTYQVQEVKATIGHNDTVWTVAEQYFDKQDKFSSMDEFMHEIKMANPQFKPWGLVKVGDEIIIPLYVKEK